MEYLDPSQAHKWIDEEENDDPIGCYLCKRIMVLHRIGHSICMECEDNMEREEFNE